MYPSVGAKVVRWRCNSASEVGDEEEGRARGGGGCRCSAGGDVVCSPVDGEALLFVWAARRRGGLTRPAAGASLPLLTKAVRGP